jgi:glycosyltransferase involved in cell wall biosynthesis
MKIGLSTLSGISYGGITYFSNLIPALGRMDKSNEYIIFTTEEGKNKFHNNSEKYKYVIISGIVRNILMRFLWEQFVLPIRLKKMSVDVFYTAKNINIFLSPVKTVIAIRNMEPFFYKKYNNDVLLNIVSFFRNFLTRISMIKAYKIIAVSEFTKKYISNNYPELKHKLHVVYNGNPVSGNPSYNKMYNSKGAYILTASKFVTYANQLSLIKGYNYLNTQMQNIPPLWLAGGIHDRSYFDKIKDYIRDNKLTEKVKILGLIEHSKLIEYYSNAFAFIFPSTLEACPHTLIEVMSCQVPMAVSNFEPMPEICTDAAIYFDPYNKKEIAQSINRLLSDNKLREQLSKSSLKRARFFDWDKSAEVLVQILGKC